MKAQELYDFRAEFEFCSGNDLGEFFKSSCGDQSPRGEAEIETPILASLFVFRCLDAMASNSPSLKDWTEEARQAWQEKFHWIWTL